MPAGENKTRTAAGETFKSIFLPLSPAESEHFIVSDMASERRALGAKNQSKIIMRFFATTRGRTAHTLIIIISAGRPLTAKRQKNAKIGMLGS